jgi:signal transduction histidine kinase
MNKPMNKPMNKRGGGFLKEPKDVITTLRLLVLAGLAMLGLGDAPRHSFPFWFTTCVYGATNLGYLFSRSELWRRPRIQGTVFLFDVVVVSLLIVLRGRQVPEFIMAYFTLVLTAAVVQGLGSALVNAIFVCVVYGAVTMWGKEPASLLAFPVLSQFAFFVVIAVFMGHVAEIARDDARERARSEALALVLEGAVAERTRDLTQSVKDLEDARHRLLASERLTTIGMLSAGVAHDIRSPLAALRSALDESPPLLLEAAERGAAAEPLRLVREAFEDARLACDQLQHLALDLTSLARTAKAEPRPVACADALQGAARLLKHRARGNVGLTVRCTTDLAAVADPGRLQQVLVNLASNGLDAMEKRGGTLTLTAEAGLPGRVRLTIEDQGAGLSPEVRAHLFEPFFTTKGAGKGTGLGLHIVHESVREHGATIAVDSEPGAGTRFTLEWPAAALPAPQVPSTSAAEGETPDERPEDPCADRGRRGEHPSGARSHAAA